MSLPDGIYLMGGLSAHNKYLSSLYRLDVISRTWTQLASMDTPRASFAAVASPHCTFIYAMGGINSDNKEGMGLLERYDVLRNRWETLAPMGRKRYLHSAVLLNI